MCIKDNLFHGMEGYHTHSCSCKMKTNFLSKKKRTEALKQLLAELQERADDVREYIKELEASK